MTGTGTATARLIDRVRQTAVAADGDALLHARLCLLDWLGVTLAGAREPVVDILAGDAVIRPGGVRLIGRAEEAVLRDAVLINGAAGHALDYDDGMGAMMGHPSVAIMPGLVGLAAERGLGGEEVLRAIVAGAEAAGRIGLMLGEEHYYRGFHGTLTVGAMAAALACAYLIGLDDDLAATALGLAGTRAAGLKASFGSDAKPLHAGWAALVGCTAAIWAERGMTGASDILGHRQGIAALGADFVAERGLDAEPEPFVRTINFKYHAACAVTHPAIDGALKIREELGFHAAEVASTTLEVAEAANDICNVAAPATGLQLKFSLRGVTAMALAGFDTASPASYGEAPLADAEVARLIACTDVRLDTALALGETRVGIALADGRTGSAALSLLDFERDPAVLRDRLGAKFTALAGPVIGAARTERVLAEVAGPGAGPDIGPDIGHVLSLLSGTE